MVDQKFDYLNSVEDPAKYIQSHLEAQTQQNSRLRALLNVMNSREKIGGRPSKVAVKDKKNVPSMPSAYQRLLMRNSNSQDPESGRKSAQETILRKKLAAKSVMKTND